MAHISAFQRAPFCSSAIATAGRCSSSASAEVCGRQGAGLARRQPWRRDATSRCSRGRVSLAVLFVLWQHRHARKRAISGRRSSTRAEDVREAAKATQNPQRSQSRVPWNKVRNNFGCAADSLFDDPHSEEAAAVEQEINALCQDAMVQHDGDAVARHRASVDAANAALSWREAMFQKIRLARLTGAPMPEVNFDELADSINKQFKYKHAREEFKPARYVTYDDWFLRELAEDTKQRCLQTASHSDVCAPVEGKAWRSVLSGEMTLKISVIAVEELLRVVQGRRLVQIRLRWNDYHRVHSPVDGCIERIDLFAKDELFPGSESMTIFSIRASFGIVKLMCIGEWSVQTFVVDVAVDQHVRKLDELGHFDLGSQVIIVLPDGVDVVLQGGEKLFPGDPIGMIAQR